MTIESVRDYAAMSSVGASIIFDDVIARVEGIRCGMKTTSCPDQLAQALKEAVNG